jgi:tetratricopeptide (TPR) repeat protein
MTELLRGQLAQSARFDLIAPDTVPRVLKEMRQDAATLPDALKLREVALRQGATLVLYSGVSLVGTAYRLDVRLEHVGARPSIVEGSWDQTFQAPDRSQLLDVVRRATIWVRSTAGESKAQLSDQDRLPSEITTGSWEGLRAFAKAQQAHQHGDLPNAVVYLQEAVRLDPEFVSAYARLGDVLISLRREPEGYAAWQRAVEIANGRQLTTRETLRLRGQFLEATGSLHETEEAFRAYVLHYPADFDANIYLGSVIAQQGRTEEAVPWLERATRLRPSAPSGHVFLATRLIELQRLDEAVAVAEALRQSTEPEWATWVSALIAFARGNLERAVAQLEEVRGTTNRLWQSRIYTLHSSWLAEAGRFADAEQELVQGIAFDAANGLRDRAALKWIHVAALRARVNDRVASADALKKAITVSDDARTLALAGSLFAQLGMPDELRQVRDALARQPGISRARRALQRVDAELWRMRGRADLAIQMLDEGASEMPFTETRDFHVRALMAAGREADAVAILADWVRHPARFYAGPEPGSPGPWAAAVDEYRVLLQRQGNDREAAEWTGRLAAFRHEQPTTLKRRIRGGDIGKTK